MYEQSHCGVMPKAAMLSSILFPACFKSIQDVKHRCVLHRTTGADTAADSLSTSLAIS